MRILFFLPSDNIKDDFSLTFWRMRTDRDTKPYKIEQVLGARERQRPICFVKQKALADGPLLEAKSERLQRRHPSSICSFFSSSVFIRRFISFGSSSLLLLSCCSRNALLLLFGGGANVLLRVALGLRPRNTRRTGAKAYTVYSI